LAAGCVVTVHSETDRVVCSDEPSDTIHHRSRAAAAVGSDVGSRCSDFTQAHWSVDASCRVDQTLAQDRISVRQLILVFLPLALTLQLLCSAFLWHNAEL